MSDTVTLQLRNVSRADKKRFEELQKTYNKKSGSELLKLMIQNEIDYNSAFEIEQENAILREKLDEERKNNEVFFQELMIIKQMLNELFHIHFDTSNSIYNSEDIHEKKHPLVVAIEQNQRKTP